MRPSLPEAQEKWNLEVGCRKCLGGGISDFTPPKLGPLVTNSFTHWAILLAPGSGLCSLCPLTAPDDHHCPTGWSLRLPCDSRGHGDIDRPVSFPRAYSLPTVGFETRLSGSNVPLVLRLWKLITGPREALSGSKCDPGNEADSEELSFLPDPRAQDKGVGWESG